MQLNSVIGNYIPKNSFVHNMDVRIKLIVSLALIVVIFFCRSWVSYALMAGFVVGCVAAARLPARALLRAFRPLYFILGFTLVFNVFFLRQGDLIWGWRFIQLTTGGLMQGLTMAARLLILVALTSVLTLTTSPIELTDGLEKLMRPLTWVRFPAHELAMMMSIALRFIPTLTEEANRIIRAQQARGADFESGNIFARAKALLPVLIPLLLSAFRRAEDLAMAMESRCYRGGKGRTRMKILRMSWRDGVAAAGMVAVTAGVFLLR